MQFLFDENIPNKLAKGLNLLEESNHKTKISAHINSIRDLGMQGATDEDVIAKAGKLSAVILTFDKDFKHIKSYAPLYKKHKVGVVFFKLSKEDSNYWGMVKLLINKWEDLKNELTGLDKPFVYQVSKLGIQRFQL